MRVTKYLPFEDQGRELAKRVVLVGMHRQEYELWQKLENGEEVRKVEEGEAEER